MRRPAVWMNATIVKCNFFLLGGGKKPVFQISGAVRLKSIHPVESTTTTIFIVPK